MKAPDTFIETSGIRMLNLHPRVLNGRIAEDALCCHQRSSISCTDYSKISRPFLGAYTEIAVWPDPANISSPRLDAGRASNRVLLAIALR